MDGNGQQTGFDVKPGTLDVEIKNCKIINYIYGINLLSVTNAKVTNNELTDNNAGMRLKLGMGNEISDNLFVSNGQGLLIESTIAAIIKDNTVRDSNQNGIQISGASKDCLLDGNKLIDNGHSGIKNLAKGNTLSNNEATGNNRYGIECQVGYDVELISNSCTGNQQGECSECNAASCTITTC